MSRLNWPEFEELLFGRSDSEGIDPQRSVKVPAEQALSHEERREPSRSGCRAALSPHRDPPHPLFAGRLLAGCPVHCCGGPLHACRTTERARSPVQRCPGVPSSSPPHTPRRRPRGPTGSVHRGSAGPRHRRRERAASPSHSAVPDLNSPCPWRSWDPRGRPVARTAGAPPNGPPARDPTQRCWHRQCRTGGRPEGNRSSTRPVHKRAPCTRPGT